MDKVPITVMGYRCERCGHEWVPKAEQAPRVCPKCKSAYWNAPRRNRVQSGRRTSTWTGGEKRKLTDK